MYLLYIILPVTYGGCIYILKYYRRKLILLNKKRDSFSSNLGFILAAAGSAIGLGNLWKFPYLTGVYGGGIFILTYLFFLVIIGVPLVLGETVMGRYTHKSAVQAYEEIAVKCKAKKWWGIAGFLGVIAEITMFGYYSVVGGWVEAYFAKSVITGLPGGDMAQEAFTNLTTATVQPIIWHIVFLGITVLIVLRGIEKGIEIMGKIMMPILFICLIIIVIKSITLPGAMEGIAWMWTPDISKINSEMLIAALGQVFFSLSLGAGATIVYGSYLQGKENIITSSYSIPILDTSVALLAGFAILPAVFAFGFKPSQGPGLLFVTLPSIFESFGPIGGRIFGILFFILVLCAAFTTSVAMLEIPVSFLIDKFDWARKKAIFFVAGIVLVLGIGASLSQGIWADKLILGYNFFDLLDALSAKILMPVGGLLLSIFIGYVWKPESAIDEITNGGTVKFVWFGLWKICLKYIIPILIICVFLSGFGIIG